MTPEEIAMYEAAYGPMDAWDTGYTSPGLKGLHERLSTSNGTTTGTRARKAYRVAGGAKQAAGGGATSTGTGGTKAGKGGMFGTIVSPELKQKFSGTFGKLANPNFNWDKAHGLTGWGRNLGNWFTLGNTVMQGLEYANNYDALQDSKTASGDMAADIVATAMANPATAYELTPDQQSLLRQLQRGADKEVGINDIDLGSTLGGGLKGALTGIAGGIPGMVLGGLGGLLNAGTESMNTQQMRNNAELEALYQSVMAAQQERNEILKRRAYAAM